MSELYRVYARRDGDWKQQKSFDSRDQFAEAKAFADRLARMSEFDGAIVLERVIDGVSNKPKYEPLYRARGANGDSAKIGKKPLPKPIELIVQKGLTGKWIVVDEKYAERHALYGIEGWLSFFVYTLFAGPLFSLIRDFESLLALSAVHFADLALNCLISGWLLFLLFKRKRSFQIWVILTHLIFTPLLLLSGDFISFGKCVLVVCYVLVSRRVNVTFKYRVREDDLSKILPVKKLEAAKFVDANAVSKRKAVLESV